ncbi:MAG TPA: helix-turn-helix transcriptional regulator [Burkholderiaceae bacterium]
MSINPLSPLAQRVPLGDSSLFRPSPQRPVRVRARALPADSHLQPHSHPWAQLAYCASGVLQVTVAAQTHTTYIVPPTRGVWIAPGALHAVAAREAAQLRTLYIDASATPADWSGCRAIVLTALMRELIQALETARGPRQQWLTALVIDELTHADIQALGVPLPDAERGDKRLHALCASVLRNPAQRGTLADQAAHVGASERTMARLFRDQLGMGYQQWRQQVALTHALPLLAHGLPVGQVATDCGYASESAFSAMFKAAMGQPPNVFRKRRTETSD